MQDDLIVKDCPYGAEDCPKVHDLKMELEKMDGKIAKIEWKLSALIMLVIALHGVEILTRAGL